MVSLNESGQGQYMIVDNFKGFPAEQVTFATQIQLTGDNNAPLISYSAEGRHNEFLVNTFADGTVHIGVANTHVGFHSAVNLYDGQMHDVAVTWDSETGDAKFFVDGKLAGQVNVSAGAKIADGGTLIFGQEQDTAGGGFDANNVLQGRINDIRIFNGVRTAEQIANDAAGNIVDTTESRLVSRYPFNEGGNVAEDFVGRNDLRLEGGVARYVPSTGDYDTAVFSGKSTDYSIQQTSNGNYVVRDLSGNDGTDTLYSIEAFEFADGKFRMVEGELVAVNEGSHEASVFHVSSGFQAVDGAGGTDTIQFTGSLTDYSVVKVSDGSLLVTDRRPDSPDGVVVIRNVENYLFSDGLRMHSDF
ncbi:MAG: hypothetical protein KDB22_14875 [Planctomycetales bacterium]|nr:hypothetical protein [Planctomycetales bacterium]